jgi:hypothetical protein
MENAIVKRLGVIFGQLKELGSAVTPYLMLELLVPGGTALAFLLFLHRRKAGPAKARERGLPTESSLRDQGAAQPIVTMAACGVILVLMLAA